MYYKICNNTCNSPPKKFSFQAEVADAHLMKAVSKVATEEFDKQISIDDSSVFCGKCYQKLRRAILTDRHVTKLSTISSAFLNEIIEDHKNKAISEDVDPHKIESNAFRWSVRYIAEQFKYKRALFITVLYSKYEYKLKEFLSEYGLLSENVFNSVAQSKVKFQGGMDNVFANGLVPISDKSNPRYGRLLHWAGNDDLSVLFNSLHDVELQNTSLQDDVKMLNNRIALLEKTERKDEDKLEDALHILRKQIDHDVVDIKTKIKNNEFDLRNLNLKTFALENSSTPLWNFLTYLTMTESSYSQISPKNMWIKSHADTLNLANADDRTRFVRSLFTYSHSLYIHSSGTCSQPLHMLLADTIDKYTKSSEQCMFIFNSLGICVGRDSFLRFQARISTLHLKLAPYNDIVRGSFVYVSLDNLDWLCPHARVRANGQSRCVNCTTYMVGQPQPLSILWNEDETIDNSINAEQSNVQSEKEILKEAQKSSMRKLDEKLLDKKGTRTDFENNVVENDDPLKFEKFKVNPKELHEFKVLTQSIFSYNITKTAFSTVDQSFPILKIFFSRQNPSEVETSKFSYIGILNESCDSKDTILSVLNIIYIIIIRG